MDCLNILFICNTHKLLSLGSSVKKAVFRYLIIERLSMTLRQTAKMKHLPLSLAVCTVE